MHSPAGLTPMCACRSQIFREELLRRYGSAPAIRTDSSAAAAVALVERMARRRSSQESLSVDIQELS